MTELDDALDRLPQYSVRVYHIINEPFGLSGVGGMAANWARLLRDVATVANHVAVHYTAMVTMSQTVATLAGQVTTHHTNVTNLAATVATQAGQVATHHTNVTSLAATVAIQAGQVATHHTAVTSAAATVASQAGQVAGDSSLAAGHAGAALAARDEAEAAAAALNAAAAHVGLGRVHRLVDASAGPIVIEDPEPGVETVIVKQDATANPVEVLVPIDLTDEFGNDLLAEDDDQLITVTQPWNGPVTLTAQWQTAALAWIGPALYRVG